jgi:hypothetical protein
VAPPKIALATSWSRIVWSEPEGQQTIRPFLPAVPPANDVGKIAFGIGEVSSLD